MKIIRAEHLGMCFGVRDAVALAFKEAAAAPLTILGDLVHNEAVVAQLNARGLAIRQNIPEVSTERVMITAHGTSDRTRNELKQKGFSTLEATCPLVHVAHQAIMALVAEGFHPVIIGKRDHIEVRGLTGDLAAFDVVLSEEDVKVLKEQTRFGVAAQTTQPIERVEMLTKLIRERFPKSEVRLVDTVCRPTKLRQVAAIELASQCDVVVVIGGAHSNNTRELVTTCRKHCRSVHHVQDANDLRPEWFANVETVGITAGTSTPDSIINEAHTWLNEFQSTLPPKNISELKPNHEHDEQRKIA